MTAVVAIQGGHVVEHIVQLLQVSVLGVPEQDALGLLGYVLQFNGTEEWLHLGYNAFYLLALYVLILPLWRITPAVVPSSAFVFFITASVWLETWHMVEHGVIMSHVIANGGCPCPGIGDVALGCPTPSCTSSTTRSRTPASRTRTSLSSATAATSAARGRGATGLPLRIQGRPSAADPAALRFALLAVLAGQPGAAQDSEKSFRPGLRGDAPAPRGAVRRRGARRHAAALGELCEPKRVLASAGSRPARAGGDRHRGYLKASGPSRSSSLASKSPGCGSGLSMEFLADRLPKHLRSPASRSSRSPAAWMVGSPSIRLHHERQCVAAVGRADEAADDRDRADCARRRSHCRAPALFPEGDVPRGQLRQKLIRSDQSVHDVGHGQRSIRPQDGLAQMGWSRTPGPLR